MKHKVVVEYEYPVEHKTPAKAELILHGDSVETWDIKPLKQEPRWIPVTERLPEQDGEYLLFGKVCEDTENHYIFIGKYDGCAEKFGFWRNYYSDTFGYLGEELIEYSEVLAWMPLPKPYKAESEG